ncbi:serine hydrolase [uncultured Chitinophaga sp.]|jgi:Beta-lactamase class C and other penicillin binding proteins|uniref:serine hydrolase domain-containing protein n=1 Tax=uncultured Chitinophaga sp. TaxID=339340 RepID=UPI0026181B2F|nr:serine hydrolase [uncultured Chitinophaga sp.]
MMRIFLVVSCLLTIHTVQLSAQITDIVKTEGMTSSLHQEHIGKIFFTSKNIATSRLHASDFLDTYKLTNKSDLFFIAFMGNSITNYLHHIAPSLPADSLVKIGNYQFTLFVDDQLIYQSNLFPGAPYAKIQDTATVINKPFINNTNGHGLWSESFWNRFMHAGGDSALTEGPHTLKMEIRPYLNTGDIKVGELIASGKLQLLVERKPVINTAAISLRPVKPYNGFEVSKERFDSDKIKTLKGSIDEGIFKKISSVVVIKNGKLLIEEYFNGEDRHTLHDPRSVGKSFASTLIGIAIAEKQLPSEDQPLKAFYKLTSFKNYSPAKENVTLKDLLTMSAVFDGDDEDGNSPGNEENMYPTDNWVKFALDLPVRTDTTKNEWHYFTAGVVLLGDILNKTLPGGLEKYADEKLFTPLGITNYKWQYTPQNVPNTAGSLQMNALDFAKYGQLYKNGGKWNGQQILPKEWVRKSFTKHQQISNRSNEYYGYLFWNKSFQVKDQLYEAFYCAGNGGNYIVMFKDLPLVIVVTATAYGQPYAHPQVNRMITEYILPAVL